MTDTGSGGRTDSIELMIPWDSPLARGGNPNRSIRVWQAILEEAAAAPGYLVTGLEIDAQGSILTLRKAD